LPGDGFSLKPKHVAVNKTAMYLILVDGL